MLGSDRFAFETPNVIDLGDLPPSQPGRKLPQSPNDNNNNNNNNNNSDNLMSNGDHLPGHDRLKSTERFALADDDDMRPSPDASQSFHTYSYNNNNYHQDGDNDDLENQESRGFLSTRSEEKKNSIEPVFHHSYHDNPKDNKVRQDGSPRFGFDPNKQAFDERTRRTSNSTRNGHNRIDSFGSDHHSLPAVEEARTYAASLLHSANKTSSIGSSSEDPFARPSSARVLDASSRRHIHESIDRNHKKQSRHLVRREVCSMIAKLLICILMFVLVALVVAVNVKVVKNKKHDNSSDHAITESPPDVQEPPSRLELTYQFVHDYLTNSVDLTTPNTPQYMAANWIAEIDGLTVDIPKSVHEDNAFRFVQRYALAVLYFSTNGSKSWKDKLGFLTEQDECAWFGAQQPVPSFGSTEQFYSLGVTCNPDLEVVNLLLPSNELQGPIPNEIGLLTKLNMLAMPHNQLDGTIPVTIVNLPQLEYLDLKFNFFQKQIPNVFSTLTKLRVLGLSNNYLQNQLPVSFSALQNLKTLAIDDNSLTGELSPTVNAMTSLEYLYADRNNFSDQVDDNFLSGLTKLKELDLSGNDFNAPVGTTFPRALLQHPTLTILDFAGNELQCSLPAGLVTNSVLKFLSFRENKLTGSVDSSNVPMLRALEHLDLQGNQLQGRWPTEMEDLTNLTYLFLGNNPGITAEVVPSWLYKLKRLRELSLTNMQVIDELPVWIDALTNLEFIDFSNNQMGGSLIREIFDLPNLIYLLLHNNTSLIGSVPQNITGATKMKMLTLFDTGVDGNMNHICVNNPGMELLAVDCKDEISCDPFCCPKCCNRQAATGVDAFCFEEAVPTYLQFFEGLWELNFTRSTTSFDPALVSDLPGNR
ncbi:hypothetical protein ACA910_005999 [Epithemia clementina (nom. ined.)]